MIDTHAHIDIEEFNEDRGKVIEEAFASGVENILIPAIEPDAFEGILKLSEEYDNLYFAIGIHPNYVTQYNPESEKRTEQIAESGNAKAIGEIGLDYHYNFSPREDQIKAFDRQLALAKSVNLPVIVHNREASDDIYNLLKKHQNGNLRGVMHCFSEQAEYLEKILDLGFFVSFTGNVTFKKFNAVEAVEKVPLSRFMIETDSPYMAPVPHRGKRNEPKFLKLVAEKIAEIKSISFQEVVDMTTQNAKSFFKLSILAIAFLLMKNSMFAGNNDNGFEKHFDNDAIALNSSQYDNNYADDEDSKSEDSKYALKHPYFKRLGIGFTAGANTIVETYKVINPQDLSYPGIAAFGGLVTYYPLDYLSFNVTYLYSQSKKLNTDSKGLIPISTYQLFEITSNWIANPYSRVNVYALGGFSLLFQNVPSGNADETGHVLAANDTKTGINAGIGFIFNIPIKGAGMFAINAEWKLNFILGEVNYAHDPRQVLGDTTPDELSKIPAVSATSFFSIPRVGLSWYPDFLNEQ